MDKHRLLGNDDDDDDVGATSHFLPTQPSSPFHSRLIQTLLACLTLSLSLNLFLALKPSYFPTASTPPPSDKPTEFANLTYNTTTPYYKSTDYSSSNQTLSHSLWHSLNIDHGVIALSDTYARAHNLPLAQRFPWDATKGIYILHGYHNLHCLKIISLSLHEYRLSLPQTRRAEHISHCLDALRRQILCDADDTPRATYASHNGVSGLEQNRQCRDWGALESWAMEHTACYRRPERPVEGMRGVEKFRWCPEGSGYQVPEDGWGGEEWMSWEGL